MRLKKIIEGLDSISIKNFKNYNINTITHISSDVVKGSIFICIKGNKFDGNNYVLDVVKNGAKCIITEDENLNINNVTIIVVNDIRIAMSIVAKNFYNRVADTLKLIGVVGTAGKTSTTLMISQLLSNTKHKVGVIGTNGVFIGNIKLDNKFTTPDPLELHFILFQMKMLGIEIVVMEVSAQAIYYKKVYGIKFDICIFTNISKEHLDFFESMEKYAKVKMDFFNSKNMKECVVNIDDFFGRELAYKVDIPCVSYGIKEPCNSFAVDMEYSLDRTKFVANILDDIVSVNMPFVGEYNVYNIISAMTIVKMLGLSQGELESALNNLIEIDGRFNVVNFDDKKIIIDFAHTPESIEKLLKHIREYANGRIVSVFGCVGYSDSEKRCEMGQVVSKYSDLAIITSDNPGNTSFNVIVKDIMLGLSCEYRAIENRVSAIEYGISVLQHEDILVLIGKGAETFQKIGDERIPYNDKETVEKLLEIMNETRAN